MNHNSEAYGPRFITAVYQAVSDLVALTKLTLPHPGLQGPDVNAQQTRSYKCSQSYVGHRVQSVSGKRLSVWRCERQLVELLDAE
jgi:hypothetical protein